LSRTAQPHYLPIHCRFRHNSENEENDLTVGLLTFHLSSSSASFPAKTYDKMAKDNDHAAGGAMDSMLNQLSSPRELETMTEGEIEQLAKEIRAFIIQSVSQTGGHLASSLGVV